MASFLVLVDNTQKVVEIIWSDPVHIITRHHPLLSDSFIQEERDALRSVIEKCLLDTVLMQCDSPFRLVSTGLKMHVTLLPIVDRVLVYAWDEPFFKNDLFLSTTQDMVCRFMHAIKNYIENSIFNSTASISTQFENIQRLNNDLINTRRMLEKVNGQLNVLNLELNNRLVKDALTGLVSRYQYHTEIEMLIAGDPDKFGIFAFIDIDNFKSVNDQYGHAIGDQYLIEFAERLKKLPYEKSIKMRISGDEFGVFVFGLADADSARMEAIWHDIGVYVLHGPIATHDGAIPLSISAGMSVYGKDTKNVFTMIEYSDYAMYIAKRSGKNGFSIFDKTNYIAMKEEQGKIEEY